MGPPDRDLFQEVERAIDRESGLSARARGLGTRVRVTLAAAVALAIPALTLAVWARVDLRVYPPVRLVGEVLLLFAIGAAALWMALRPLHRPPLPRGTGAAVLVVALATVLFVAVLPPAHQAHPASLVGGGDDLMRRAAACLSLGLAFSAPILTSCWLLERRGKVVVGAVLLAGLAGVAALQFHCPIVTNVHLVAGHATVIPALLLATVFLWRRA